MNLIRGIAGKGRFVGFDLVEMVPDLDIANMTGLLAARLILSFIGEPLHTRGKSDRGNTCPCQCPVL